MNSQNPATCCFATTSKDHPIQLWDAFTGQLRCSYRAFDHMDELTSAYGICFSRTGERLYSGHSRSVRAFDVAVPGRECQTVATTTKVGRVREGVNGILASLTCNPDFSGILAVGSYSNTIGLYDERDLSLISILEDSASVTQVLFSPDGRYLFSGGRKSPFISCWDIRQTGSLLFQVERIANTNQRLMFDIDPSGHYLATGSQDGRILVFSAIDGQPVTEWKAHQDAVNGCSFNPVSSLLASSSGQRKFPLPEELQEEGEEETYDARMAVWRLANKESAES